MPNYIKSVSMNDIFFHLQWLFIASSDSEEDKKTRKVALETLKEMLGKIEKELSTPSDSS